MNLTVTITEGPVGGFQSSQVVDHILVTAQGSVAANTFSANAPAGATSCTLTNVAADTYTVTAQAKDINNNNLGPAQTTTAIVSNPTVSLTIPTTISAAQS